MKLISTRFSTAARFVRNSVFVFLLVMLAAAGSLEAQTWSRVYKSPYAGFINKVKMVSETQGFAVGNLGKIYNTTDGGQNWTVLGSGTSNALNGVSFVSTTQGWAVGNSGTILTTNNGGTTWTAQSSGGTDNFTGVFFVNSSKGWAVTSGGVVYSTIDGGANWTKQVLTGQVSTATLFSVFFIDANNGWISTFNGSGTGGGLVLSTTDGGATWTPHLITNAGNTIGFLRDVFFISASKGWAVGDGSTVVTTNDGGATWTQVSVNSSTNEKNTGIYFTDANNGWMVSQTVNTCRTPNEGGGAIYKTSDGGSTWSQVALYPCSTTANSFNGGSFTNVAFTPSGAVGVAVGSSRFTSGNGIVSIFVNPPQIVVSGSLPAMSTFIGTPSTAYLFTASGISLKGDVTVTPPSGFEVSNNDPNNGFQPTLALTNSGTLTPTNIYVRLTGVTAGTYSGNVVLASTGATSVNVAVPSSTVTGGGTLTTTGTLNNFVTCYGTPSAEQSFSFSASSLGNNDVTITAPAGIELSLTSGGPYSNTLSITPVNGDVANTNVYVRSSSQMAASSTGNIVINSASVATPTNISAVAVISSASINQVSNVTLCGSGNPVSISFTSKDGLPNTFNWTNDNPSIGLAASGTGNIQFTNSAVSSVTTAHITVTPTLVSLGCVGTPISFTIKSVPAPSFTGVNNFQVCNGDPVSLATFYTQVSGYTYKWNGGASYGLYDGSDSTLPTLHAINNGTTTATAILGFEYKSNDTSVACQNSTFIVIKINPPTPSITGVTGATTICAGNTTTLTATSNADAPTYQWYDAATGGNLLFTGAAFTTPVLSTYTTFYVVVAGNCATSRYAVPVTVNPLPSVTISASGPTNFCTGGSVTLTASAGTSYLWSNGLTTQSITVNAAGTYSVTVSNGSCSATSAGTTVTVTPKTNVTASASAANICAGSSTTLTATGADSYVWMPGNLSGASVTVTPTVTTTYTLTPSSNSSCVILPGADWQSVAAGDYTIFAIKADGSLWASGFNAYGQVGIGIGTSNKVTTLAKVGNASWNMVSASIYHTLGIKADGTLWSWGLNANGQLGLGNTVNSDTPKQVGTSTWKTAAAGLLFSIGIKKDGTLWSWGYNGYGQLGTGNTSNVFGPVQIGTDTWTSVTAGEDFVYAIKSDGTLWGFGHNNLYQLGLGNNSNVFTPTQISSDTWKAVTAGQSYGLGIKSDGSLWAFGYAYEGGLGLGTTNPAMVPTRVGTDTWKTVSAKYRHTLGINSNNKLFAWGYNSIGQLGNNNTNDLNVPTQIGTDSWNNTSAGQTYSNAIKADGSLWVWGSNTQGEFGAANVYPYLNSYALLQTGNIPLTVRVNVDSVPPAPSVKSAGVCGTGQATLTATNTGSTIDWYSAPTGGTLLATGNTFTTPTLTQTTTYYTEARNTSSGCVSSSRTAAVAQVINIAAQTVSSSVSAICGSGSATISLPSSQTGVKYLLRNNADNSIVAGPIAGTGGPISFNTDNITSTTTYNVLAQANAGQSGGSGSSSVIDFNGGYNSYAYANATSALNFTSSYTIESMIYVKNYQYGTIVAKFEDDNDNRGWMINMGETGDPTKLCVVNSQFGQWINHIQWNTGFQPSLYTWYHIAVTFDANLPSNNIKLYVNGSLYNQTNWAYPVATNASRLYIGGYDGPGNGVNAGANDRFFNGRLDEIRLFNTARSASDIQASMSSCLNGTETGLVAYYKADEGNGSVLIDDKNGNNANFVGASYINGGVSCGTVCSVQMPSTVTVTVNAKPTVAPITGGNKACPASTIQLTETTTGGVWSSSNTAVATVNANGLVTTLSAGTVTISYTVTGDGGCTGSADYVLTIAPINATFTTKPACENSATGTATVAATGGAGGNKPYGITSDYNANLVTIDLATGAGTVIGSTGIYGTTRALAVNAAGEIFASNDNYRNTIFKIDPATGVATMLPGGGEYTCSYINGMSFNSSGELFGWDYCGRIYKINTTTGVITTLYTPNQYSLEGMSFDPTTGDLYGVDYYTLYKINLNNNANITQIGSFSSYGVYGVTDVMFDPSGKMYIVTGYGSNQLYSVDKTNATPTLIGYLGTNSIYGLAGGGSSYTYLWDNGETKQTASGLTPGSHTVTVTDINGCSKSFTVSIDAQAKPAVFNVTGGGAFCNGGQGVQVGLSGSETGVNYQLKIDGNNTGGVYAGTGGPIDFGYQYAAGTYTVEATNAQVNCPQTMSGNAVVVVNPLPDGNVTYTGANTICQNATLTLQAATGTGYTYQWMKDGNDIVGATGATYAASQTGYYSVRVTSPAGCSNNYYANTYVTVFPTPVISVNGSTTFCSGYTRTLSSDNGNGLFNSYTWSNAQTGNSISVGNSGTYTVTASNGSCSATSAPVTITATENTLSVTATLTSPTTCFNTCDGSVSLAISGGTAPYPTATVYDFSGNSIDNSLFTSYNGIYTQSNGQLVVGQSNSYGGWDNYLTTVKEFPGDQDITYEATFKGGNQEYAFGLINASNVSTGYGNIKLGFYRYNNYGYFIVDGNFQTQFQLPDQNASYDFKIVKSGTDVKFYTRPTGGTYTLGYTVAYNNSPASFKVTATYLTYYYYNGFTSDNWIIGNASKTTGLCPGTYTYKVFDASGCFATTSINVPVSTAPGSLQLAAAIVAPASCANTCDGVITLTPSGGTAPYFYGANYNFNSGAVTDLFKAGQYSSFIQSGGVLSSGTGSYSYPAWNNNISTIRDFDASADLSFEGTFNFTSGYYGNLSAFGFVNTQNVSDVSNLLFGVQVQSGGIYAYYDNGQQQNYIGSINDNTDYDFKIVKAGGILTYYMRETGSGDYNEIYSTSINYTGKVYASVLSYNYYGGYYGTLTTKNWTIGADPKTTHLCAGTTYNYTVYDATGCAAVASITIPVSDAPGGLKLTATATSASCNNGCSGTVSLVPSGGTAPYSYGANYNFNGGALTDQFNAGQYSSFTQNNGVLNSGTGGNYYTGWANNLSTIRSFDASSDLSFEGTFNFTSNYYGNLSAFGFVNTQNVNDASNLLFGLQVSSSTLYAYYNNGQQQNYIGNINFDTDYDFKIVKAGNTLTYYMRQTGSGPYNQIYTTNISVSGKVYASVLSYNYYNGYYGSLSTKNWVIGATPKTTNVCPGTYTYTVYDATGCAANATVTVVADPNVFTVQSTTTKLSAPNACDGTVTFSSSQGETLTAVSKVLDYPFSGNSINTNVFDIRNGAFTEGNGSLSGGSSNNNCTGWDNSLVTKQAYADGGKLSFELSFNQAYSNYYGSFAAIGFANSNNTVTDYNSYDTYFLFWNNNLYAVLNGSWNYISSYSPSTWYDYKIEKIGATVNYYTRPDAGSAWSLVYSGTYNGSATSFKAGISYQQCYTYYGNFSAKNLKITGAAPTTGLCAGAYNYTVYSEGGCSQDVTFKISGETALTATNQTVNPSCYGSNNGSITITATGGTAPYKYSIDGETYVTTNTFSNLYAGQYTIIVKDANDSASAPQTVTLTQPAQVVATASAGGQVTFCAGGSVTLTSGSATGNVWSTGDTTQSINVNSSGNYTVTVTVNGCSATSSPVTVTVNALPAANITASGATTFCAGGSVNLTASAGASYLWSNNATTQSIIVSNGGNYSVTVTNAEGCSTTSSVTTVTVNPLPVATITADGPVTFCEGGSVNLTASAGNSYVWNNGANTQTINVTAGGDYNVIITNADGCLSSAAVKTVTVNPLPTATITADGATSFCAGGSVNLTASAGASYLWSNGATTQSINVTVAGDYSVTVTNAEGCSTTSSITSISLKLVPTVNTVANQEVCHNGTATAAISFSGAIAGTVYNWTNNTPSIGLAASGTGDIASFLAQNPSNVAVTATITVTPSYNGCTGNPVTFTIRVDPIPVFNAIANQTVCNGSATTAVTFVGQVSGTNYSWFGGSSIGLANGNGATLPSFNAINNGTTAVSVNIIAVSNAPGINISCGTSRLFTITVNPTPVVSGVSGTTAICSGASTTLTASSAVANTTFKWYDAATGGNLLSTGATYTTAALTANTTYYVEASANGCIAASRYVVAVTINAAPTVSSITGTKSICAGTTTVLTATSAASGAVFNWYDAATGGNLLYTGAAYTTTALNTNTTYYVEVVSGAGCVASSRTAVTVNVTTINDQTITTSVAAICGTGAATVNLASSQIGVNYTLRNNLNNAVIAGPIAGTGGAISFNTGNISSTTTYNVYAQTAAGGGLKFDGLNKFVNLNYNTGTLGIAGNSFTVSVWIYRTDQDARDQEILGNINGCNLHLILRNNKVYLGFCGNDLAGNTVIGQNQWYHISYVYNASSHGQAIYVNGSQDAISANHNALVNDNSALRIGGYGNAGNAQGKFAGIIDEMQIWNSALSTSQVAANMNTCLTGNEAGLIAYFNFDEGTGTTLTDKTGHGFSGTLANMSNSDWTTVGKLDCSGSLVCSKQLNTTPTVTVNPLPTLGITASASTVCNGTSVTLSGSGASSYSWSGGITNGVAFVPSATTTYTVTGTDANGCVNTASKTITVNALPVVIVSTATPSICVGSSATISTATNLVGYWKFDEGSGSTVADQSGNNLNGTFINGPGGWVNSTAFSGSGTAATFGSKYIQVADNAAINNMQSHFTIEAWVYQTDNTNNTIVDRSNYNFLFEINPNGAPGLGFYNPNDGWSYSTTSIPINQWVHVACTWDGATRTLKFYKNGVQTDVFVRNNQLFFNAGEINIGRQSPQTCGCNIMTGNIDELRLWSVVKSPSEIAAAMNGPIAVSSPATFTWSPATGLNTTTGSTVIATPTETTTYTITATNSNNCVATATQTIIVNALPTVTLAASGSTTTCPGSSVVLNAAASAGSGTISTYVWYKNDVLINGATTSSYAAASSGSYTVLVTNSNQCSSVISNAVIVTVEDVTNPVITCPADISVNNDANKCGATLNITPATATDNCSAVNIAGVRSDAKVLTAEYPIGTTTITWTATDASGNKATCTQTVNVKDNQPPVIVCPGDITVVATGANGAVVNYTAPVGTDNCAGTATALTAGLASGSTFPIGTTLVTYTATDAAGLTASCSFSVNVSGLAPQILCPTNITVNNAVGQCGANVNFVATESTAIPVSVIVYTVNGEIVQSGYFFPIGTTTVVATATNAVGVSTCSFTVTVNDNQLPVFDPITDLAVNSDAGKCGATVIVTVPTASDNCGVTPVTGVRSDGLLISDDYPVGTTTVTWTVTDIHGNKATAVQIVTVVDDQKPIITAPGAYSVVNDPGVCGATLASIGNPVTSDNCGVASVTNNHPSTFYPVGTTIVTWTVTDIHGNVTDTATQSITVIDNELPTITVINVSRNTDLNVCGATIQLATPVTSDNCGVASVTNNHPSTFYPTGTTYVTWTVTDIHGLKKTTVQTIVVKDVQPPTVITKPITVYLDGTGHISITAADVNNGSNDACGIAIMSVSPNSFDCSKLGANTVTLTVTDVNGNTSTKTAVVTVQDKLGPVPTVSVLPTVTGQCSANIVIVNATCSDNCRCCRGGCHCHDNCRCHRNDNSWNNHSWNSWWWNNDDDDDDCDNDADDYNTYYMTTPTAMDNCSGLIKGTTTDPLHCNTQGTYTINWKFVDANGNVTIQPQTVIVSDNQAPIPWVSTLPTISGQCSVNLSLNSNWEWWDDDDDDNGYDISAPWAWDNCAGWIRATTASPLSYTTQGTYTIAWKFNDGHGNITTQNQTVIVKDNIAPKATVKNLPTVTGSCSATVTTVPTAKDNCAGMVNGTTTSPLTYTAQGTYTITWTYSDGNGNASTQTQTVIVKDNTAPVPMVTTLPTVTGECSVTVTSVPKANDNCKGVITATTTDPLTYTNEGTYTIHWSYNDGNGNITTQNQTVIINDVTAPVPQVATLPTLTGECSVTVTSVPKANDNCKGVITATTSDALTYNKQGTYTIRWSYNDGNGNTSTQNQTVVISDVTKPNITAPAAATVSCGTSTAPAVNATATDNCSTPTVTYSDVTSGNTITRTWKATDAAGNYSTATQTLTIVDNTAPTITDPRDVTVSCGTSTDPSVTGRATATDNCSTPTVSYTDVTSGYTITRTWTAKDASNNSASSIQVITIVDNTKPVIATLSNVTVNCGASTDPSATGTPTASDNCSGVTLGNTDVVSGNTITRTWKATDASGNYATSVQVITIGMPFTTSVTSVPTSNTYTGGVSTNLYLGYGAQSTTLQVGSLPSSGAPYTYAWSGTYTSKLSSTTASAPVFTPTGFGYYTFSVTVTNKYGCTASCSISICVTDVRVPGTNGAKIYVTHTPNGKNAVAQTLQVLLSQVSSHIGSSSCGSNGNDRLGSTDQSPCNTTIVTNTGVSSSSIAKETETVNTAGTEEDLKVTAMPNPSTTFFTLKIESRYQTPVELRVMDGRGRVVDAKSKIGANSTIQIGHNYSSGTYYAELIQGTQRKVVQLIKGRG